MTTLDVIFHLIVILVGFPASLRNATAVALCLAWIAAQVVWIINGAVPGGFYLIADITVIAAIYAKAIYHCGAKTYDSRWHQTCCMITDLTLWDLAIVSLYIFGCWPVYVLSVGDWTRWFLLWMITAVQFCLAGAEAYISWRRARASNVAVAADPPDHGLLRLAR